MKQIQALTFSDLSLKIAVPYNHDLKILDVIEKYKDHLYTLYLPVPPRLMFSGDVTQKINWQNYEENEIFYLQEVLAGWQMDLSLLLNITTCYDLELYHNFLKSELYQYIKKVLEKGINRFVIADISLARLIKENFKEVKIEVSLNAFINSIKKAIHWVDFVDPDTICVAEDMNKDLGFIHDLKKATGKKIKILVNSRCQPDCPNGISHANLLSQGIGVSPYPCGLVCSRKPWFWYRGNAITPYNLRYYTEFVDYIKFLGRNQPTYAIERDLRLYVDHCNSRAFSLNNGIINERYKHYDDLARFIIRKIPHPYLKEEPPDVFGKVTKCKNNCQICNWCFDRWKKDWQIKDDIDPKKGIIYKYEEQF
ncbi:MAG: U32 family peptidase [Candidatus Margulisiibacteriota bacterium]|jgi:hypothetical protein